MAILATEAVPIAAEALGGGEAAAASGGAGRAVGSQAAKVRQPKAPSAAGGKPTQPRGGQGGKGGKKGGGALPGFKAPKGLTGGSTAHKLVVAEFILVVFLIGFTPLLSRKSKDGKHLYVANDFVRLTAACLLFFILALLANGKQSAKFAAAFGGLVALGTLFNANTGFQALAKIFTNAGTKGGSELQTAAAETKDVTVASYNPTGVGVGTANPTGPEETGSSSSPGSGDQGGVINA